MNNIEEPMRYKYITRLGNWYERKVLEETRTKDYLEKKQNKQLPNDKKEEIQKYNQQEIKLSYNKDKLVHYGDFVMLENIQNNSVLMFDNNPKNGVTTVEIKNNDRTRVMQLMPLEKNKMGDVIKYGDKLKIQSLQNDNIMTLHSSHISPTKQTKLSKRQEVEFIENERKGEDIWQFDNVDPKERFKAFGKEVHVKDVVLIKHVFTQQWLGSDSGLRIGQGIYEVFCHSCLNMNKSQNLISEKEGRTTSQEQLRNQESQNSWRLIMSEDDSVKINLNQYLSSLQINDLLTTLKHNVLQSQGLLGLRKLHIQLHKIYQETQTFDIDNFKWILINYNIKLDQNQLNIFYDQFPNPFKLDFIINLIIPQPNHNRIQLIKQVYSSIKQRATNKVTLKHIAQFYDPSQDPHVLDGSMSEEQVFNLFMSYWFTQGQQNEVKEEEFLDYYKDISSAMDRDDHFDYLIRTAWGQYQ